MGQTYHKKHVDVKDAGGELQCTCGALFQCPLEGQASITQLPAISTAQVSKFHPSVTITLGLGLANHGLQLAAYVVHKVSLEHSYAIYLKTIYL